MNSIRKGEFFSKNCPKKILRCWPFKLILINHKSNVIWFNRFLFNVTTMARPHSNHLACTRERPGLNHSQSLMAGNFAALWSTDPKFSAFKDLNLLKKHTKNQDASSILKVVFALSKSPHLHRELSNRLGMIVSHCIWWIAPWSNECKNVHTFCFWGIFWSLMVYYASLSHGVS